MNLTNMTIKEMCTTTERQLFDRKSAKLLQQLSLFR